MQSADLVFISKTTKKYIYIQNTENPILKIPFHSPNNKITNKFKSPKAIFCSFSSLHRSEMLRKIILFFFFRKFQKKNITDFNEVLLTTKNEINLSEEYSSVYNQTTKL